MLNLDPNFSSTVKIDTSSPNYFFLHKKDNRDIQKDNDRKVDGILFLMYVEFLTLAVSSLIRRFLTVILLLESKF